MQRTNKLLSAVCVASFAALSHGQAIANVQPGGNNAVMSLTVSGSISARPQWQNASNAEISTLTFAFDGFAEATTNQDVDSDAVSAKLVNATVYPADVAVVLPTSCTIGGSAVSNTHVKLVTDAYGASGEYASGTHQITDNGLKSYALRFAAAGNYGALSGAVTCTTGGTMTYTY